jgi:signal transduction histidine kinase
MSSSLEIAWNWIQTVVFEFHWLIAVQIAALVGASGFLGGYMTRGVALRHLSRSFNRLKKPLQFVNVQLSKACQSTQLSQSTHSQAFDLNSIACLEASIDLLAQRAEDVVEKMNLSRAAAIRSEKLACLGQLAASTCHELRNPLLSIRMLVEGLREEAEGRNDPVDDFLLIEREVLRMQKCLDSFVGFARPVKAERVRFCLEPVIHQTVALIGICARKQGVRIQFDRPQTPTTVEGDPGQIEQVLVNLMINALEAMPRGGHLKIALTFQFGHIELGFEDSGSGIHPSRLPFLFNSFVSSKETGHGLGLALSRSIAESHGGGLKAMNMRGGGARFTLYLPAARTIGAMSPDSAHELNWSEPAAV